MFSFTQKMTNTSEALRSMKLTRMRQPGASVAYASSTRKISQNASSIIELPNKGFWGQRGFGVRSCFMHLFGPVQELKPECFWPKSSLVRYCSIHTCQENKW